MRNNSTSSISGIYAVSSTSAGRTRSRTPRCWRGHSSPASSPPCARHRHAGQVTYPECQTREYPNSCCTVNLVKGQGRQRKRFKDSLKANLKDFNIDVTTWENTASERSAWKIMVHKGALRSEAQRSNAAKVKRSARKARAVNYTNTPHTLWCQTWLQGLPCPHLSHQQSADTSLNGVKCRLTWSYSKIELTNNNTKCGHFY